MSKSKSISAAAVSVLTLSLLAPLCAQPLLDPADLAAHYRLPLYELEVIEELPHSTAAFTQGLLIGPDRMLYESTGIKGKSELRRIDPGTGAVLASNNLDECYFGEGLSWLNDRFYQLTWQAGVVLCWDSEMKLLQELHCDTPGWGLTSYEGVLLQSDGSNLIYWRSPDDFGLLHQVEVFLDELPVTGLNELEIYRGQLLANVLGEDFILQISPEDGIVNAVIDAGSLRKRMPGQTAKAVLNGIAWDREQELLYLTGKYWPKLFKVRLVAAE